MQSHKLSIPGATMKFAAPIILPLIFLTLQASAKGPETGKKMAATEDGKVMSCTVEFRSLGAVTWFQTQKQAWQLPEKKGSIELKAIGDVEIWLSKESTAKNTFFSLSIKQGKHSLGEIKTEHRTFEFATAVDVKVEDGPEGWQANHVRVACDANSMGG
jgi:hypothetical protein